ncbi:hypothetical protein [Amycolatopsis sp. lyj-108]|uniref:hypothetical protein n=1 Tax=Amycolatopsis sp. lyj-108 TaxID=2789286 RepID=UPI00397DB919
MGGLPVCADAVRPVTSDTDAYPKGRVKNARPVHPMVTASRAALRTDEGGALDLSAAR